VLADEYSVLAGEYSVLADEYSVLADWLSDRCAAVAFTSAS
jgi:hypothetical protein